MNSQQCSNVLTSSAQLQYIDGELIAAICQRIAEQLQHDPLWLTEQALSNSVWSAMVLYISTIDDQLKQQLTETVIRLLQVVTTRSADSSNELQWSEIHCSQLHQVQLWLQRLPPAAVALSDRSTSLSLPPSLAERCAAVFTQLSDITVIDLSASGFHRQLLNCLNNDCKLTSFEVGGVDETSGLILPIVDIKSRTVILPEGPHQLYSTKPHLPTGSSILRRTLLTAYGYTVIPTNWYEWSNLKIDSRAAYLSEKMNHRTTGRVL